MRRTARTVLLTATLATLAAAPASAAPAQLSPVGRYSTDLGEDSAEIVAYDGGRAYVINTASSSVDILQVGRGGSLTRLRRIDLSAFGAGGNSVAAKNGLVAVALDAPERTDPGQVVFLNRDGRVLTSVAVGAVPDMVTFTPDGKHLLVANEGEPSDDYSVDPEGSVSVLNVRPLVARRKGKAGAKGNLVRTADFRTVAIPAGVRIFGPGATPAQDIEPEYITVAPDGRTAYVSLQENNAIAVLDIQHARITRVFPLGLKDHRLAGNALDANDRDRIAIAPATVPLFGMYQPDGIASFDHNGQTLLITANEGDVREWGNYEEAVPASSLATRLDPAAFPLGLPSSLGRLKVSTATGDTDTDGDFDQLHAFGARSFSIFTTDGQLVFDSGDQIERFIAATNPAAFNVSNSNDTVDNRSDDKGPEPENVTVGEVAGQRYAFVALERVGGVLVVNITDPTAPVIEAWPTTAPTAPFRSARTAAPRASPLSTQRPRPPARRCSWWATRSPGQSPPTPRRAIVPCESPSPLAPRAGRVVASPTPHSGYPRRGTAVTTRTTSSPSNSEEAPRTRCVCGPQAAIALPATGLVVAPVGSCRERVRSGPAGPGQIGQPTRPLGRADAAWAEALPCPGRRRNQEVGALRVSRPAAWR